MSVFTTSPLWTKVAIGGTVALVASVILMNQISKAPQMELSSDKSSSSAPTGGSVTQNLKDKHNRIGVEKKSTSDLLLSLFVYKMCTFNLLVDLTPKLIRLAEMMHLSAPAYWIGRKTFFAQFCGGETAEDCIGTMNSFKNAGINSILDLSIEFDLNESDLTSQTSFDIRARCNKSADDIANQISACIETASNVSRSFAAIKVTAISSPLLLQQVSSTLNTLQSTFKNMDQDRDGKITKEEFRQLLKLFPSPGGMYGSFEAVADQLFKEADKDQNGHVDWVDFTSTVSLNRDETRALFASTHAGDESATVISGLAKEDLDDYRCLLARMEKLCD
ncbi:hypothetical protein BGZ54_009673 [Gamsiella multidivaricata]|nr:hypothetical protein BGZ54_009673 [Gamsiella multidivaricata]